MQSTGHTSTQAWSWTSMHSLPMTYVMASRLPSARCVSGRHVDVIVRRVARGQAQVRVDLDRGIVDRGRCFAEAGGDQGNLPVVGGGVADGEHTGQVGLHGGVDQD